VSITVGGQRFRYWSEYSITRELDGIDTIALLAPFDSGDLNFREVFMPGRFRPLGVLIGGQPLFTGVAVLPSPEWTEESRTVQVSGYGRPGVLQDCTMPVSAFPLEFNGVGLQEIAERLCEPFGLGVAVEADLGSPFSRVAMKPTDAPWAFLVELAKQRGVVLGSTARGELALRVAARPGAPVGYLQEGAPPLTGLKATFRPQAYYSSISGVEASKAGKTGETFTVHNPWLPNVVRPLTIEVKSEDGTLQEAVLARMGQMFGELASFTASVAGWRDPSGALWSPNTTVSLFAPGNMVYDTVELLIRRVQLSRSESETKAELTLVLPAAFASNIPEVLPWVQ
jgi:prophage tail gpP-like protein